MNVKIIHKNGCFYSCSLYTTQACLIGCAGVHVLVMKGSE
jgi:hypothetical protein